MSILMLCNKDMFVYKKKVLIFKKKLNNTHTKKNMKKSLFDDQHQQK